MRYRLSFAILIAVAWVAIFAFTTHARAGDHWLSGPVEERRDRGPGKANDTALDHGVRLFDLVISVHNRPSGDAVRSTTDERTPYEEIIEAFADGVYEQSNGWHRLRKVHIYSDGRFEDRADIVWLPKGHPAADPAGMGSIGHIYMFDVFEKGGLVGGDLDFLSTTPKRGGYTLAHEWGHYAYGLYDEYATRDDRDPDGTIPYLPRADDQAVQLAIMSNHWKAVGLLGLLTVLGDLDALNHSTSLNFTTRNAQARMYGASGWETLLRPNSQDPPPPAVVARPVRPYWPELGLGAPIAGKKATIDLPGNASAARQYLEIIWKDDTIVYQIVIDRSGSMDWENKMINARSAAKLLVDQAEVGKTQIGIVAFDSSAQVLYPITLIDSESRKSALKAAIDSISAYGGTYVGAAADLALDGLSSLPSATDSRLVFLLTDGESQDDALAVIPRYQSAQVPIFAFAYGSSADEGTLRTMATSTKGTFFAAPVGLAAISAAFQEALSQATVRMSLGTQEGFVAPGTPYLATLSVDSTVATLNVVGTLPGAVGGATAVLRAPDGSTVQPASYEESGGETLCRFALEQPDVGAWIFEVASSGATGVVTHTASALPLPGVSFAANVACPDGAVVQYPRPMLLLATLEKGERIAGAGVRGNLVTPSGIEVDITLRDDGVAPDERASDGTYSGEFFATENGAHDVRVRFDNSMLAATLVRSSTGAPAEDGLEAEPLSRVAITELFSRTATRSVVVEGVVNDDHGDSIGSATALDGNGTTLAGRIDRPGDLDVFSVTVPETGSAVVSVGDESRGMDAVWRLVDAEGVGVETEQGAGSVTVRALPFAQRYLEIGNSSPSTPASYAVRATAAYPQPSLVLTLSRGDVRDVQRADRDQLTIQGAIRGLDAMTFDLDALLAQNLVLRIGGFEQGVELALSDGGWRTKGYKRVFRSARGVLPKVTATVDVRTGAFVVRVSRVDLPDLPPAIMVDGAAGPNYGRETTVWAAGRNGRLRFRAGGEATSLTLDVEPLSSLLPRGGATRWFCMLVPRSGPYEVVVSAGSLVDKVVALYQADGATEIARSAASDGVVSIDAPLLPGAYFIGVSSSNRRAYGTFTIVAIDRTRHPMARDVEVGDDFVTTPITVAGGVVRFRFVADATARFAIESALGTVGGTALTVLGPDDGSLLLARAEPATGAASLTRTLLAGVYYVEVEASSQTATGDFQFRVRQLGSASVSLGVGGDAASGSVSPSATIALFEFRVLSAGTYTIETTSGTLSDTVLTIYGPDDPTVFVASDDDGGVGFASLISRTLGPGLYYAEVRAYSGSSSGNFSIIVR